MYNPSGGTWSGKQLQGEGIIAMGDTALVCKPIVVVKMVSCMEHTSLVDQQVVLLLWPGWAINQDNHEDRNNPFFSV